MWWLGAAFSFASTSLLGRNKNRLIMSTQPKEKINPIIKVSVEHIRQIGIEKKPNSRSATKVINPERIKIQIIALAR
tara:strand:+ start:36 stop:266 length:231 start_codon:yes stop_codon:yes gene_type:complete